MTEEVNAAGDGISRRSALRRLGAAGAIAWTAPLLTSINTPAHAQQGGSPSCTTNLICGQVLVVCGEDGGGTCNCVVSVSGKRICGNDACGPACETDADCQSYAPGAICQAPETGCCGQACIAPCGAFDGAGAGSGSNSGA